MKLFRVEGRSYASYRDEYCNVLTSREAVEVLEFAVVKETTKCFWIQRYPGGQLRLVRKEAHKKFANQTLAGAYQDFIARKQRQKSILTAKLRLTEKFIFLAQLYTPNS